MFNRHWFAEQQQIIMFQSCDHAEANTDCGDGVIEVAHREDDDDTEDDDEGPSQCTVGKQVDKSPGKPKSTNAFGSPGR